MIGGGIWKCMN